MLYMTMNKQHIINKTEYLTKYVIVDKSNLKIYYKSENDGVKQHIIIKTWNPLYGTPLPEENEDTAINIPFEVIEINIGLNRDLVKELEGHLDQYYINDKNEICKIDNNIVQTIQYPINNIGE